jgi:NifU-like protein
VSYYPPTIMELLKAIEHSAPSASNQCVGRDLKVDCGCFVEVALNISNTGSIETARFRSNGCGYMVAAAEATCRAVTDLNVQTLNGGREIEPDWVCTTERFGCIDAVRTAVRKSLAAHRKKAVNEFRGDSPLFCSCFGITEDALVAAIRSSKAESIETLWSVCNAGRGCGSCQMLIVELIEAERTSRD